MEYAFHILQNSRPSELPGRQQQQDQAVDAQVAKYIAGICTNAAEVAQSQELTTATADLFTFLVMGNHRTAQELQKLSSAEQKSVAAEVLAKIAPTAGGKRYDAESLKNMPSATLALFAYYPTIFAANETEKELENCAAQIEAVKDDEPGAEGKRMELRARHGFLYEKLRRLLKDTIPQAEECKKDILFDEKSTESDYDKQQENLNKLNEDLKKLEEKNRVSENNVKIPELLAPVTALAEARSGLDAEVEAAVEFVTKLTTSSDNKNQQQQQQQPAAPQGEVTKHADPEAGVPPTAEENSNNNNNEQENSSPSFTLSMPGLLNEFQLNWQAKIVEWKAKLATCEGLASKFAADPAFAEMLEDEARKNLVDFATLKQNIATCERLGAELEKSVGESNASNEAYTAEYTIFDRERKRMLQWCRQQRTNLDAIVDPDELQEFCASLLANHSVMEQNVAGLLEMAEPPKLLPRMEVQKALSELSEVWLHLHVSALERLQRELIEIHDTSRLEDEVRAFAPYSTKAKVFLQDFQKLLTAPADAHSRLLMQPMVAAVEELLQDSTQHEKLSGQLHEFVNTMEGLRENYLSFRKAVLSRVTFLAGSTPTISASLRRRDEYTRRMNALSEWVAAKSRGEHWSSVRDRLDKLQNMIDEEIEILKTEAEDEEQKQKEQQAEVEARAAAAAAAAAEEQQKQREAPAAPAAQETTAATTASSSNEPQAPQQEKKEEVAAPAPAAPQQQPAAAAAAAEDDEL